MTFFPNFIFINKKFNLWKENNMNSMNMPEKIEAKKGCIFILCFYFSQFVCLH
jgi:hypothetical protein